MIKTIAAANGYKPFIINDTGSRIKTEIENKIESIKEQHLINKNLLKNKKSYESFHYNNGELMKICANRFRKFNSSIR